MRFAPYLCVFVLLSSCGGGGSSPAPIPNRAPVITDPGALSVLEGISDVVSLSGTDADGNTLSFSILSGDDQSLFRITSSGVLSFTSVPDFETPDDADTDNEYLVSVEVTDGTLTDSQSLVVSVIDQFEGRVVDAPISGAACFIDLNGNNEQDEDEPSGTTNADGFFNAATFTPPEGGSPQVVCKGGIDTKTGKALPDLTLISDLPADITKPASVTPLTTVIASVDTPEAKAAVLVAMGISGSLEDLLTTDGWAAAEAGDEEAIANQRINQQVGLLLQTAATVVDDGQDTTGLSVQLAQAVAKQISTAAVSDAGIDLTSAETLQTVLAGVIAEVAPEAIIAGDVIAAIARSVAAVNTVVSDPNLDPLSDVAADIVLAAQVGLQKSVTDIVSGDVAINDFETATDTTMLFEDIVVAEDAPDTDEDGIPDALDKDDDGDGVVDGADAFPLDTNETLDTDADGVGNNADTDDDADGVADTSDAFPLNAAETLDTDGDGTGNNADTDDDGDGVVDTADAFPLNSAETLDTDSDGTGNNADTDDDGDGVVDSADAYSLITLGGRTDTDSDGRPNDCDTTCLSTGMAADADDDGDSVVDTADDFPLNSAETLDTDSDGTGNNADPDDDNDTVADGDDAFPLDASETVDTDGDEIGNNADPDDDNDTVADGDDAFPLDGSETLDTDGDEIGNNADPDDDNDSYIDANDAFPLDVAEWLDTDGDELGNNADPDDDNDTVADGDDAFPLDASETVDTDGDEIGNNADLDDDGDGVSDTRDDEPLDSSDTPPTALFFYASELQGSLPLIVSFDASDTIAGYLEDEVTSYSWNFGDESSGMGKYVDHTFTSPGSFDVVLTVLNSDDRTDTFTQTVVVSSGGFSVSGVITVSELARIDSDVNDLAASISENSSFTTAQSLDIPTNVIGYVNTANYGSSGKSFSAGDPLDYYQFDALGGEIINLIMDSPGSTADGYTDLDMYLYDSNLDLVGYSIGVTQYESLMIPLAVGTYYLRVNVWSEGAGKYYLSVSADNTSIGSGWSSDSEFAIGDIIVQERASKTYAASKAGLSSRRPVAITSTSRAGPKLFRYGTTIGQQNTLSLNGLRTNRLTVPSDIEMRVATLLAAKELSMNPAIEYAEPNFLRRSTKVPIDERYGTQWHYDKIRLPEAWDITTGSTDVKVAVIDTGIFEAHPDLNARLSDDGFDFINNAYNAGDGEEVNEDSNGNGVLDPGEDIDGDNYLDDGQEIDNDADDPGDGYENSNCGAGDFSSSFHGTHVAGTVGAETNNDDDSEDINANGSLDLGEDIDSDGILDTAGDGSGNGVAGVTWAGEIMNLRVLGCAGGYDFDIANAIRYAAGLENQSGIIVDDPADIANMSLGGGGTSSTMRNAIADATAAGLIIVAAAGNSATELPSYPAAYTNVISVSATLTDDSLASYSNFGATVDVAAPGSAIESTLAIFNTDEQKMKASYASYNGTSMAAPHVAGVVSLMKSVYPDMSPSDFDAILLSGEITVDLGDSGRDDLFGVGRIDAAKAVAFSKAIADGLETIPVTPILFINETYLNFGKTISQYSVSVSNVGNGSLAINAVTAPDAFVIVGEPTQQNDVSIYPIGIDRTGLVDGVYFGTASFDSNGGVVDVSLVFKVMATNLASEGNLGNISVVLKEVSTGLETPLEIQSASDGKYTYSIGGIAAGMYEIHSGTDIDNDGVICGIAEACGAYPTALSPVTVEVVNEDVIDLNFSLDINTSAYLE